MCKGLGQQTQALVYKRAEVQFASATGGNRARDATERPELKLQIRIHKQKQQLLLKRELKKDREIIIKLEEGSLLLLRSNLLLASLLARGQALITVFILIHIFCFFFCFFLLKVCSNPFLSRFKCSLFLKIIAAFLNFR